ncbi:MAG: tyrosine-type recombinase/integrase [Pseudomonadota bacterium]
MAKLTKRLIDALQAGPEGDLVVWDEDLKCFGIRVKASGVKSFCIQYRNASGQSKRLTLGRYGPLTPEQARRLALQRLSEVVKGNDPVAERTEMRKASTVKELAERYLSEHAGLKKKASSQDRDERLLTRFILPALGTKKVVAVTRADVARLHHTVGQQTPIQANRVLAVMSKMMTLAIKWGIRPEADGNPCRYVERFKEAKRERYLTAEELARLGTALSELEQEGVESPSVIAAMRLLIFTGCRREEILSLKWEHVDFERACLRLPDSKTGAKTVPLGPPALELLAQTPRLEGNPYVCPGLKPGGHLIGLPKAWGRIQKRAGLERVRLHDLRHSFASVGAAAGLGLPIIGALLGHTQAATTQRYAHLADDPLQAAAAEITKRIAEAMNKPVSSKVIQLPVKR